MKKKYLALVLLVTLVVVLFPARSLAVDEMVSLFKIGSQKYFINYNQGFDMDVAPFISEGRAFIPVRYLANSIGIGDDNIKWDPVSLKVTLIKGDTTVEMVIGKKVKTVNGREWEMDVAPLIEGGRIFLPARYLINSFLYYRTSWNETDQTVSVSRLLILGENKEYVDLDNHFRLQYPASWKALKFENVTVAAFYSNPEDCNDHYNETITIMHVKNPEIKNMTLDQLVDFSLSYENDPLKSYQVYERSDGYLDNVPARVVSAIGNNRDKESYIYLTVTKIGDEFFAIKMSAENKNKMDDFSFYLYDLENNFKFL